VDLDIINVDQGMAAWSAFLSEFDPSCLQARVKGAAIKVTEKIILSGTPLEQPPFFFDHAHESIPKLARRSPRGIPSSHGACGRTIVVTGLGVDETHAFSF
jgi:hypothetical protein